MVVQPSSNSTHNSFLHCPRLLPTFQHLSPYLESIPYWGCYFYSVGRKRPDGGRAKRRYPGLADPGVDGVLGALELIGQPGMKRSGK